MRAAAPVYSHGNIANMLDPGECRAWAQRVKQEPEGFTAFKFGIGVGGGGAVAAGEAGLAAAVAGDGGGRDPFVETPGRFDVSPGRQGLRQPARGGRGRISISRCIAPDSSIRAAPSACVRRSNRPIHCGSRTR